MSTGFVALKEVHAKVLEQELRQGVEELSKEHKRLTEPIGRYGRMWDFFTPPKTDELTLKKGLFQYMEYVHLPSVHFVLGACFDIHPTKGTCFQTFLPSPLRESYSKIMFNAHCNSFHFLMHNIERDNLHANASHQRSQCLALNTSDSRDWQSILRWILWASRFSMSDSMESFRQKNDPL